MVETTKGNPGHDNKSVLALLKDGEIGLPEAIERAEVSLGQGLALIPGGKGLIALFEGAAGIGGQAADVPLTIAAKAIEAPVDAFFVAKLGPFGAVASEAFNTAFEESVSELKAFIDLKAAEFKASVDKGAASRTAA